MIWLLALMSAYEPTRVHLLLVDVSSIADLYLTLLLYEDKSETPHHRWGNDACLQKEQSNRVNARENCHKG